MIISKRNHMDKMEMAKPLKSLIDDLTQCSVDELPNKLSQNSTWERPRGDLFHWVSLLNRFDEIFEQIIKEYELDQEFPKLREIPQKQAELLISCLNFTYVLLDHCANRSIYSSSERAFHLINATNIDVKLAALEVAVSLSERFVQTSSSKYAAPKAVKLKVLLLAKSYPPQIPLNFHHQKNHEKSSAKKEEKPNTGSHFSLLDTITTNKKYPSKWKLLQFQYFKSELSSLTTTPTITQGQQSHKKDKTSPKSEKKSSKKNKIAKQIPNEGLSEFNLSEDVVKKLSLEQIYDKASEGIPREFWFEFSMSALIVKAFNTKSYDSIKLREKLLRIKFLAIAFVCCMCPVDFTSPRLFEAEPYIFSFLVDFVQPDNSQIVPKHVFFGAVKALECISMKRAWGNDIIRCMGGNVNHGVLFQVIRDINKKIRDDDGDIYEKGYIHFFNMLGNLIDSKSTVPRLTAGGILDDLMLFFDTKSKYRWTCSAAIHLITLYLNASPDSINEFIANDGFKKLIETIGYEVTFALENPNFGGGPPKESLVFYNISFRQANYIRSLMKLVSHLIQSESGDRLRNLFDSPLLQSFNNILLNPNVFGPLILSATIDSVFYIIHNEPTAFSILNEAKVIDTILDNFESLFLPSSDLLMSLPEVLGAICLNNDGLKKVVDLKAIPKYFKAFFNLSYAKELVRSDMTTNLGCSFDELGRHYPSLKPIIMEETTNLVKNVAQFGDEQLESIHFYNSAKGALYKHANEEVLEHEEDGKEIETWEAANGGYILDNVFFFLGGLLQDSGQWGDDAIKSIKFELWVSFLTLNNAPFDYTTSNGLSSLMGVLKYFDDEDRAYGLPVLFRTIKEHLSNPRIQEFKDFANNEESFFSKFEDNAEEGTLFLKELNKLNTLMYTLSEIYINQSLMFNLRYRQIADLFGADSLQVIEDMGSVLRRLIQEEIIIRTRLPSSVAKQTSAVFNTDKNLTPIPIFTEKPGKQDKQDGTSAKFKNTMQIRFFAYRLQNHISTILSSISRICLIKRQDDITADWRRRAVDITNKLAEVLTKLLDTDIPSSMKLNYLLIVVNICGYLMIQKERARDFVHTSFIVSLISSNFFNILKKVTLHLWTKLLDLNCENLQSIQELEYTSSHEGDILTHAVYECLNIFQKVTSFDSYQKITYGKLFFHDGYNKSVDSHLIPTLLIQVRIEAVDVLLNTIGKESSLYERKRESAGHITSKIINQLISIFKVVWRARQENPHSSFIPLDTKNVTPPIDQVQFLESNGLSAAQADGFFKNHHEISQIPYLNQPVSPKLDISESQWSTLQEAVRNLDHSLKPEYSNNDKSLALSNLRTNEAPNFQEAWIKIVALYPQCAEEIASMFKFITSDLDATLGDVVDHILESVENNTERGEDLSAVIHLLCLLLRDEGEIKNRAALFDRFLGFFYKELDNITENINKDYFAYGLHILAQMMSYRSIPQPEATKQKFVVTNDKPHSFDDERMDKIFNSLIKVENITDSKSAIGMAKNMILFAKEGKYTSKISESKLLKNLISLTKSFIDTKDKLFDVYQRVIIVLIRICFESKSVLKTFFSAEITNLFSTKDKKIGAPLLIAMANPLIFRDADLFVEEFSKLARFNNYDGTDASINSLTLSLKDTPGKSDASCVDDVEMTDANIPENNIGQESKTTIPSTGIIHTLLSELMEVSKKDWVSDPKPEADVEQNKNEKEKKKESNIASLMNNSSFAYSCFLLKTITELIGSYKQSKLEFLTFSKKQNIQEKTKPRSTALNFLIHQLIPTQLLTNSSGIEFERRDAISSLSKLAILALVSTPTLEENKVSDPNKEDADMTIIRKFYVDVLLKILKDTLASPFIANVRYGKLIDLFDLCGALINPKFRELSGPLLNKNATKYDSYFITKALVDKQVPNQITNILSEVDLNYPNINRVVKAGLKPLNYLSKVKTEYQDLFKSEYKGEKEDDDIVPDDVDDKDETPDLFRNSTLGMYDVDFDSEDDEMDYYDDEGALEVLMSGEDVSDDDSDDSDLDSDMDEDINIQEAGDDQGILSIDDGYDDSDIEDGEERYAEDNDIEIIDELDLDSQNSHDSDLDEISSQSEDADSYDEGDEEIEQIEEDDDASDYDEDELDGWIEAFEDDDESSNDGDSEAEEEDTSDPNVVFMRMNRNRHRSTEANAEDDDMDEMSDDSSDIDDDSSSVPTGSRRRARDFATSFFDALRPAMGQPNIASLFGGLFSNANDDSRLLRGSIQIGGVGDRPQGIPRFDRALDFLLGSKSKSDINDPLNSMYVKSTKERWDELLDMFFRSVKSDPLLNILPAVFNRIEGESLEYFNKKKEEAENARKEREEKHRKKLEKERIRNEEEAKQREEAAAVDFQAAEGNEEGNLSHSHEPVMVRIGDREVDIGGTEIDPEFFEALPDDMREEVFTQHVRERRANASNNDSDAREIDPDFLDALPEQIRDEILQQESMARRFSAIEDELRFEDGDEDEGDDDEDDEDANDEDAETSPFIISPPLGGSLSRSRSDPLAGASTNDNNNSKKSKKVFFTPLIERSGVASLVRLLFIPQPTNQRDHIHHTLQVLCHSKPTRIELMNILIGILQDGLHSQRSIEKLYHQITIRSLAGNNNDTKANSQFPIGGTPIIIGIQIIEAIHYLLERNTHMRYYLLTEHDNTFIVKSVINRKNKYKLSSGKEEKYPINYLLKLLDNPMVTEEQSFVDILARVLHIATRPLQVLHKNQKSKSAPISIPIIPDHNYRQIIKILTSSDCPNITFRRVISAMQSLSILPNAQKVFSIELSDQATNLGQTIIHDLNSLTKELTNANDYNTETKSFAKFSASSSDQAKLLRILTALDYMFESKEKDKAKQEEKDNNDIAIEDDDSEQHQEEDSGSRNQKSGFETRRMSIDEIEELTGLYKRLALGTLWDALSDCLRILEEKEGMSNVATALLPLIEALMVVCKHSKVKELQIKDVMKFEAKKIDFTKEPIESLFFSFTDEHKKILNHMVRTNPNLMSGPFGMLVRNPRVLEFDNKKNYFDRQVHINKKANNKLAINIRRDQVFLDSYRSLFFKSKEEFRDSKLDINFKGESGIDAGGVTREWYQVLSRQMFNPDYALFTPVASDETTFHPNRTSYINPEHLSFFKFIGRIIGKAIYDGSYLDCHFSRAVYKRILGKQVSLKDMENLDLEYFKSLMWMLENNITDVITEDFSVETDDYGEHKIIDLIENGRNIPVTELNKTEYVKLVVEYRLTTSVIEQMNNFITGFHEIIPKDLVSIFDEQELELLISGLPDISVDDWKNNSNYNNYSPSSIQIQWFWRAVKSFDNEERAKLLQFATGTSKVPLNGFKELSGANGTCKFSIHRDYGNLDRLPSSHTCFNQIDLPAYESYETLRGSLLLAITEGHEGFGLA